MPKVAVQLLLWNGKDYLEKMLASLAAQTFADFELLVLDNGSSDGTAEIIEAMLKNFPHPHRLLKVDANIGFAAGHNRLFCLSQSEYIFCVNQDVVLDKEYLHELVKALDADPGLAAVSGVLRHNDGKIDSAGMVMNWYEKIYDITKEPLAPVSRVFGVSGALPVYRRTAVLKVSPDGKLFDESFFSYKEDADLAWRLNNFGWTACAVAAAKATHERNFGGDKKWNASYFFKQKLSSRNHLLTLVKNMPAKNFWRLPVVVFYELGKMLYLAVFVPKSLGYIPKFFWMLPNALKARKVIWQRIHDTNEA